MSKDLGILEAIDIAMEAETNARDFYNDSIEKVSNQRGRDLLKQLADFEQSHFDKLFELKESLTKSGEFIEYLGTSFERKKSTTEIHGKIGPNKDDILKILRFAIESEEKAKAAYKGLSEKVNDPKGKEMFKKLAQEEEMHWRILNDEFYNIVNKNLWTWGD